MEKKLQNLIKDKNYEAAADLINNNPINLVTYLLQSYDREIISSVFNKVDESRLCDIIQQLSNKNAEKILLGLENDTLYNVVNNLPLESITNLSETLSNDLLIKIINKEILDKFINNKKYGLLKQTLSNFNESDLAKILESLPDEEQIKIFRLLPKDLSASTFVELDYKTQEDIINKLTDKELNIVLEELFLDDMADIVEEMPANVLKRILAQSDNETRTHLNNILKYPKDSAGSIMTVEFVNLRPTMTVKQAFERIRKTAIDKETIYTCYISDSTNKLVGYISAKELLIANTDTTLNEIMHDNVIFSYTHDDREEVARKISNYDFLAIPIVDDEHRLVGIVTVDDAIDVINEEVNEDISKMAAVTPTDKPYLKTSIFEIWKNRVPWLLILMISSTFTGLIINNFESQLSAISSVLFACVPMIMGTGGNAGSQASVTIIRSLATNELLTKDILKVIWKELRASLLLGLTLGIACFAKLIIIDGLLFQISDYTPIRCLIIAIALTITIILAKLVGCILPILAKKLHLDPAVVANPFITTIIDIVSLVVYCYLAVSVLG